LIRVEAVDSHDLMFGARGTSGAKRTLQREAELLQLRRRSGLMEIDTMTDPAHHRRVHSA